ncbi:MAG TPA: hypothetical protein ENI62_10140 [Gammaproteobacteria bacterium]|nr:hypothetical protein [Gammaproteobacteria bacterium]
MTIRLIDLVGTDPELMFSPFTWRTRMSLLHKGLDFQLEPWHMAPEGHKESGYPSVPVMYDKNKWIGDSWEIAKYLDEEYPDRPVLFPGKNGVAHAKIALALCGSVFPAMIACAVLNCYENVIDAESKDFFRKSREEIFGATLEQVTLPEAEAKENLAKALAPFDEVLEEELFLGGPEPTYADYGLFGILKWGDMVSSYAPLDSSSNTGKWFDRLSSMYGGYAAGVKTIRS